MSLRVVFDTNVLFSAVGWRGNPAKCVQFSVTRRLARITCVEILDELAEKLALKLAFTNAEIGGVLGSLLATLEVVEIPGTLTGTQPDPKDDRILECALVANATHVVTGDRKHLLPLVEFRGVRIVTPAELVQLVESTPP